VLGLWWFLVHANERGLQELSKYQTRYSNFDIDFFTDKVMNVFKKCLNGRFDVFDGFFVDYLFFIVSMNGLWAVGCESKCLIFDSLELVKN
jgi:hypothetical protein